MVSRAAEFQVLDTLQRGGSELAMQSQALVI